MTAVASTIAASIWSIEGTLTEAPNNVRSTPLVIDRFSSAGFVFRNAVRQPVTVVWSMHKKKRPGSTLAGEIILNFTAGSELRRPASSTATIARGALDAILEIQPQA